MDTLKALIASRAVIASERNWTRGDQMKPMPWGYAHCALGAVKVGTGAKAENHPATLVLFECLLPHEKERARRRLIECFGYRTDEIAPVSAMVAQFNNASNHQEVLALFDRAIERQMTFESMKATERVERERVTECTE